MAYDLMVYELMGYLMGYLIAFLMAVLMVYLIVYATLRVFFMVYWVVYLMVHSCIAAKAFFPLFKGCGCFKCTSNKTTKNNRHTKACIL